MSSLIQPMVLPPEPRPVEGWYWLRHKNGHFEIMQWFEGAWLRCADACELWPSDAHAEGWSLHSKVEEPAA